MAVSSVATLAVSCLFLFFLVFCRICVTVQSEVAGGTVKLAPNFSSEDSSLRKRAVNLAKLGEYSKLRLASRKFSQQ